MLFFFFPLNAQNYERKEQLQKNRIQSKNPLNISDYT